MTFLLAVAHIKAGLREIYFFRRMREVFENLAEDTVVFLEFVHIQMSGLQNDIESGVFRLNFRKLYGCGNRHEFVFAAVNNFDGAIHTFQVFVGGQVETHKIFGRQPR